MNKIRVDVLKEMVVKTARNSVVMDAICGNLSKLPWRLASTVGMTFTIKPIEIVDDTADWSRGSVDTNVVISEYHHITTKVSEIRITVPRCTGIVSNANSVEYKDGGVFKIDIGEIRCDERSYVIDPDGKEVTTSEGHRVTGGISFEFEVSDLSVTGIAGIASTIAAILKSSEDFTISEYQERESLQEEEPTHNEDKTE